MLHKGGLEQTIQIVKKISLRLYPIRATDPVQACQNAAATIHKSALCGKFFHLTPLTSGSGL